MSWAALSSVGSFRVAAAAVALSAVALLIHQPEGEIAIEPDPHVDEAAGSRVWSVRTDGWVLRVDGAEIALPRIADHLLTLPKLVLPEPRLSPFDQAIKRHAAAHGFDWRLIAAIIFEESRFQPDSLSPKGAFGLMQVRPIAADAIGEVRFKLPEDNIRTGVRYLAQLRAMFDNVSRRDRLRFVLAAYNMGPGHLGDAQELARRLGYDPLRWEGGLREVVPLLEEPRFYETVSLGYAQGRSVVRYVDLVVDRYRHYQRMTASAALEEIVTLAGAAGARGDSAEERPDQSSGGLRW